MYPYLCEGSSGRKRGLGPPESFRSQSPTTAAPGRLHCVWVCIRSLSWLYRTATINYTAPAVPATAHAAGRLTHAGGFIDSRRLRLLITLLTRPITPSRRDSQASVQRSAASVRSLLDRKLTSVYGCEAHIGGLRAAPARAIYRSPVLQSTNLSAPGDLARVCFSDISRTARRHTTDTLRYCSTGTPR
jgi:hypothetical protein